MRAIILCILISIVSHWALGQDSVLVENRQADTLTAIRDGFLTEEEMEMYYWIFNHGGRGFISAWTIYSDECWADSTNQTFHVYSYGGNEYTSLCPREYGEPCIDPGINPGFRGHRTIYTHREPTFTGFMEFLKMKMKP